MQLLESIGNLRPVRQAKSATPTKSTSRCHSRGCSIDTYQTLPPPSVRLRLDEAFDNARRNRQSNVFPSQNTTISNKPWRRWKKGTSEDNDSDASESSQMAHILHPNLNKSYVNQQPNIALRGEASLENRLRGLGSLCLKEISQEESILECRKDVHIRCPRGEALDILQKGRKGVGVSILFDPKGDQTSVDEPHNPIRSLPSSEAYANWQRDRIKESGSMEQILNQGWSCKSGLAYKPEEIQASQKYQHPFDNDSDRIDHTGSQMAEIFGVKSQSNSSCQSNTGIKIAPRSIPPSAAPNAAREGVGMAERFGLIQVQQSYAGGDSDEIFDVKSKATESSDMWRNGIGPRVKYEGVEYANRNCGTLNNSNLHSMLPDPPLKQTPRVRPEALEICESHRGQMCKLLLTNDKLKQVVARKPKFYPNSNDIIKKSRGGAARECLNPSKVKWSKNIRMTRTALLRRRQ
ncbi:unnamed protein product [Trichobilharzia szidati]|nr:unnamed protein product [Trichobilharzia szidati]